MASKRQQLLLTIALVHLALVLLVCARETLRLVGSGLTIAPASWRAPARGGDGVTAALFAQTLAPNNPVRQTINAYLHSAGIESGYGFFAPNVPSAYKLVFELHYPEERVEYESAGFESGESMLRFASLMDYLGRLQLQVGREYLIKSVAHAVWQTHPEVNRVRAILGSLVFPSPAEFRAGQPVSYQFLVAYDFARVEEGSAPAPP